MTNDIAIQLLFDRINVLGKQIGGFIIKDRQKFEKAVAKMMYEEILNTETLREILNNENTYNLIYKFLKELIDEQIVNNIDDKCIGNIPGFERFVESLQMNASKVTEYSEIIDLRNLLEKINTSEFLSEEQFQHIVSKINILINETDFIKSIQKNIAYHIAQKNFTDFFSEKLIDNLFDGLIKKLSPLIQDDALHDTIIRNSKYSIYTLVEESFIKYLKLIKDNTLLEILGEERLKKLVTITQDYMGQLFKNKCVVKHLECLIFELANELQKNKTPIRSLIGPNIIDECKKTIYSLLPLLLTTLREFIETTSDNITGFVHKKIEQAIKQSGSSVTKIDTIADKVYKSFQEYDFIAILEKAIDNPSNSDELYNFLCSTLDDFLTKESLSTLLKKIDKSQFQKKLLPFTQLSNETIYNFFASQKLDDILKHIDLKKLIDKCYQYLNTSDLKKTYLLPFIEKKLQTTKEIKLEHLGITNYIESDSLYSLISTEIQSPTAQIKWNTLLYKWAQGKSINELVTTFESSVTNETYQNISEYIGKQNIGRLIKKLNDKPQLERLTSSLISWLSKDLDQITKKHLEKWLKKQLSDISNEDLKGQIQSIMGSELKVINLLGMILGGVVSPISATLINTTSNAIGYIVYPLSYGVIGWTTNVLAIYALFQPYQKKLGVWQGVVPKNKKRFAHSFGNYVQDVITNKERLNQQFNNQKEEVYKDIDNRIKADNYTIIHQKIELHQDNISEYIYEFIQKKLSKDGAFGKHITKIYATKSISTYTDSAKIKQLFIKKFNSSLTEGCTHQLLLKSKNTYLSDILNKETNKYIITSKVTKIINSKLTETKLSEILATYSHRLFSKESETHLIKLVSSKGSHRDSLGELSTTIRKQFTNEVFIKKCITLITNEVNDKKTVKNLFSGILHKWIIKEIPTLANTIIDQLNNYLINHRNQHSIAISEAYKRYRDEQATLKKIAMKLVKTDAIVDAAIHGTLKDLVYFIRSKKTDLTEALYYFYKDKVSNKPLHFTKEVNIVPLYKTSKALFSLPNIEKTLDSLLKQSIEVFLNYEIGYLSKSMKLYESEDIFNFLESNLRGNELSKILETLLEEKPEYIDSIITNVSKKIDSLYDEWSIYDFVIKDYHELIEKEMNLFFENMIRTAFSEYKSIDTLIEKIIHEPFFNIIDNNTLEKDILQGSSILFNTSEFSKTFKKLIACIITDNIRIIPKESLDYLNTNFLVPTYEYGFNQLPSIVENLGLEKAIEESLLAMPAEKLHEVFKSFAGNYFTRIKTYGWIGGISGIGIPLAPLYMPWLALIPLIMLWIKSQKGQQKIDNSERTKELS